MVQFVTMAAMAPTAGQGGQQQGADHPMVSGISIRVCPLPFSMMMARTLPRGSAP